MLATNHSADTTKHSNNSYEFLREFTLRYTAMSAILHRQVLFGDVPEDIDHWRYRSIEEALMFNCTLIEGDPTATRMDNMIGGNCFANAFRVSLQNPEYRYTEGWATTVNGTPTHHAWLTGPDGSVHDPTWKTLAIEHALDRMPTVYFGATIERDIHLGWFYHDGSPNILYYDETPTVGVLTDGFDYFDQFRDEFNQRRIDETISILDKSGLWRLLEGTTIFVHSRTGQRWCGSTKSFMD